MAGTKAHDLTVKTFAATHHLNVPLDWASEERVLRFVDVLRARVPALISAVPPGQAPASLLDQLERLAELRSRGILTEAEFEAAKQKALGR
jgi:Short C-terminal domain